MTLTELIADLPHARAALIHVTQYCGESGNAMRALSFTSPESAWSCFAWAKLLNPEWRLEISRRGRVVHAWRAAVETE